MHSGYIMNCFSLENKAKVCLFDIVTRDISEKKVHDKTSVCFSHCLMDMHSKKKPTKQNLSMTCIGAGGELLGGEIQGTVCSKSL